MTSVGSKTFATIVLILFFLFSAIRYDLLDIDRVTNLDPVILFLIGFFSCTFSALIYRYLKLGERSNHCFGFRKGGDEQHSTLLFKIRGRLFYLGSSHPETTFEFLPSIQRVNCLFICFLFLLLTLDNRSLILLRALPETFTLASSRYCPDPAELNKSLEDPTKIGCKLIFKAYELGLVKTLGDCAESPGKTEGVCRLRQVDEPILHYTYRQLSDFFSQVAVNFEGPVTHRAWENFKSQYENVEVLFNSQVQSLVSSRRSVHHIWTNLPHPRGWIRNLWNFLSPSSCLSRFKKLPFLPKQDLGFSSFEYGLGHLLFNSTHTESAGYCPEYFIHWGAPAQACASLGSAPIEFLVDQHAFEGVGAVLKRWGILERVRRLKSKWESNAVIPMPVYWPEKKKELPKNIPVTANRVVSFQCLMVTNEPNPKEIRHPFTLLGQRFVAREIQIPSSLILHTEKLPVRLYADLASVLSPGFKYVGLFTNKLVDEEWGEERANTFLSEEDYLYTRLEILKSTDLFLGNAWIQSRDDLLEVYPWFLHLSQFVKMFRREYQTQRGRL